MTQHHHSQKSPGPRGRQLLLSRSEGFLSTTMADDGSPYGSVMPFALDPWGAPLFLTASLAVHHKNMAACPRASLLVVQGAGGDIQSEGRISLIGSVAEVAKGPLWERYFRFFPSHRAHLKVHPFTLWTLAVERARFIAGFGDIHWLGPEDLLSNPVAGWEEGEQGAVDHLNESHQPEMASLLAALGVPDWKQAKVCALDPHGVDLLLGETRHRVPFQRVVESIGDLRGILASMIRSAKS